VCVGVCAYSAMSGKEQEFVPVGRRDRKKEKKQPQAKPQPQKEKPVAPKVEEKKSEVVAEKPAISEHTVICNFCYQIGHTSENCSEKKGKTNVSHCIACGKAGHHAGECTTKTVMNECFFCGDNRHTMLQCPEREKLLFERDGHKKVSTIVCRNCGCVGHTVSECKEPVQRRIVCMRCGEVGHQSSKCTKPAEDSSAFRVCRHCGEIGHLASECKVPSIQKPDVCPLCGQIGHTVDECPADMPAKPQEPKAEPVHEKAPRKKNLTGSDLQDTEQFPSL